MSAHYFTFSIHCIEAIVCSMLFTAQNKRLLVLLVTRWLTLQGIFYLIHKAHDIRSYL